MAVQISGNDITVPRDGSFTRNVTIGGTLTYEDVTNIDSVGLVTARNGIEIGARPGVAASISVDGNMIVSGISTFGTINLGDSDELRFGAGSDLSIFHNGNHSFIKDSGTGSLFVQTDTLKVENAAGDESMITATQDGAVELYHNGNLKLATNSDGVSLGDNVKLRIGDAPDYKLYHNGSNTYHENYTGDLFIKSDQMYLTSWTSGETYLHAVKDGRVALYHDNSLKFETNSTGAKVKYALQIEEESGSEYYQLVTNSYGGLEFQNETTKIAEFTDANSFELQDDLKFAVNGKGIDFSAQTIESTSNYNRTVTAEKIDYYEEGYFDPTAISAGLTWDTSNNRQLRYVRIGNWVSVSGLLLVSSRTSNSNTIKVAMPFTSANQSSEGYYTRGVGAVMYQYVTLSPNMDDLVAYVGGNENYMRFFQTRNDGAGGWTELVNSNLGSNNSTQLYFSVNYMVA